MGFVATEVAGTVKTNIYPWIFANRSKDESLLNDFISLVNETKNDARIFVILGMSDCHLSLLEAFYNQGLFNNDLEDEYFVVGVNVDVYEKSG